MKYRNVTFGDNFLGKMDLSKNKIFIGYLDFHVNSKQTAKPGLSMRWLWEADGFWVNLFLFVYEYISYIIWYIFVNWNWVDTLWQ